MALKNPILSNPIAVDIPKLNEILDALSKANPTNVDGISTGAVRLYEVSSGKWQWQVYNGSTWASVPFLQHNVDQLDGYHAAITPAANTVAVRGTDGKLKDDIAGNAATATLAATLSQTLPVAKGGTGATTSAQARTNLGVPPTSHASTSPTYGVGNDTQYGHLKLSDATNIASGASGGTAATPAAVKIAKDAADAADTKAQNAQTTADAADTKAQNAQTTANSAMKVFSGTTLAPLAEKFQALGNVSGTKAVSLTNGLAISATITGATTFSFTNVATTGATVVVMQLTNGGSKTITWPSSIKWAGGTAPKLTASGIDIIVLTTNNGGTTWYGIANIKYA